MKVAVLGMGLMGKGIAQSLLASGHRVYVYGKNEKDVASAVGIIDGKNEKLYNLGKISSEEFHSRVSRISIVNHLSQIKDCEIAIEAITENWQIKCDLLRDLSILQSENLIVASNTSSISITDMALHYDYECNFLGIHFFNPAEKMKLVEVTRGLETSDETFNKAMDFVKSLGKLPLQTRNNPGFVVNRILLPMINESFYCLQEGTASVEDIDMAMKTGCNFPMGPFELAKFIGYKVCCDILKNLYVSYNNEKFIPCKLLLDLAKDQNK